jgi:hypothetical protein
MPQNSRAMFKENPMFAALRVLLMRRYDAKAAVKDDPSKSIRIPIHRLRLYEVRATLVKWSIRFNDSVLKNCCAPYARMETEKRLRQENDVEWEKKRLTEASDGSTEMCQHGGTSIAGDFRIRKWNEING